MPIEKFPSPAHADEQDAFWIGDWSNDAGTETAVVLGKGEREIFDISRISGERILRVLRFVRQGAISHLRYNCHDFAETVFGSRIDSLSVQITALSSPRGEVIEPWQAADRFGLPCGVQFQNPGDKHMPVIHNAVLLGIDPEAPKEQPIAERAVVIHKPGNMELEIVTLADAVARYADRLKQIAYYDPSE